MDKPDALHAWESSADWALIAASIIYEVNAASDNEKTRAAGAYLKEHYLDKGKLGRPSGEGFYNYVAGGSTREVA